MKSLVYIMLIIFLSLILDSGNFCYAQELNNFPLLNKTNTATPQNKKILNQQTAAAVNQIPGVKVAPTSLEEPAMPPIRGFHPVKRALRPIQSLQALSIQLEQQIMRLEGPIAALQPPMLGLQKRMTNVESKMGGVQDHMGKVETQITGVESEIKGVRSDLSIMRKQIGELQSPIQQLQKPLTGVAGPLTKLDNRLDQVQALMGCILLAILIATVAIAVGTPIAAIIIYVNRKKIFPGITSLN